MKWKIVADSSCDLMRDDVRGEELVFSTVPFIISVGGREYEDNEALDTLTMVTDMERCEAPGSTACPSPMTWMEEFREGENVVALTISANLSGSYNSACLGRDMLLESSPEKQVAVLNSNSTGPALAMCISWISQWIKEGHGFEAVTKKAAELLDETKTIFALSSFDNLVKNGRVKKITGFVAKNLGLWGVGVGREGRIAMKAKARGASRAVGVIIEDMLERGFSAKEVVISHCHNAAVAEKLCEQIKKRWSDAKITVLKTRGLDSFYAERGGLIVAFR